MCPEVLRKFLRAQSLKLKKITPENKGSLNYIQRLVCRVWDGF